jgi:uncharacterized membrane protein YoaK (UPF0700 family)
MRMVGTALSRLMTRRDHDPEQIQQVKTHGIMLISFILGAVVSAALCRLFGVRAIWFVLIPLIVLASDLLYVDMK